MAEEQQQPTGEPTPDVNPNEATNAADERLEKLLSIAEKTNRQIDGLSAKTRINDNQINDLKAIIQNQQKVLEELSKRREDNSDENFGEVDNNFDPNKIVEIVQKTTREELNKGRIENSKVAEQQAKERLVREAKERGIDLSDEYAWNEFISGDRFSDNPKEQPLFRIRVNKDGYYENADNAYKDLKAHFNKRFANVSNQENKTADYTPSANPENSGQKGSGELTAEDKKVQEVFGFDEKKMREVKENVKKADFFKKPVK